MKRCRQSEALQAHVCQSLPPSGSLKYGNIARRHPKARRAIDHAADLAIERDERASRLYSEYMRGIHPRRRERHAHEAGECRHSLMPGEPDAAARAAPTAARFGINVSPAAIARAEKEPRADVGRIPGMPAEAAPRGIREGAVVGRAPKRKVDASPSKRFVGAEAKLAERGRVLRRGRARLRRDRRAGRGDPASDGRRADAGDEIGETAERQTIEALCSAIATISMPRSPSLSKKNKQIERINP